jgi:hypothetical protein
MSPTIADALLWDINEGRDAINRSVRPLELWGFGSGTGL